MLYITLVCAVIVTAFALFASERMRVDLVAMLILATLVVIGQLRSGFLSVEEAFSGFSNEATLTIGAMFILSTGLTKTGAIGFISRKLTAVGDRSQTKLFVVMIAIAGVVSAFINNTAAVAIFLPIALGLAITTRSRPTLRGGR